MSAWEKGDAVAAFKKLNEVVNTIPVSIEAHRRLADGYQILIGKTEYPEKKEKLRELEDHYRKISDGLLKSIAA